MTEAVAFPKPSICSLLSDATDVRIGYGMLLVLAVAQQCLIGLDCDVSWLLTVGDRVFDGATLYRDIIETNPPASVLLYLPGIAIAHATGLTDEFVTATAVFLTAALSILATTSLAIRGDLVRTEHRSALTMSLYVLLLILPAGCFAQREHIAVVLVLPVIVAAALIATNRPVGRIAQTATGLCAGLLIVIKPHFLLALCPLALATYQRRSLVPAIGQAITAVGVIAVYAAGLLMVYPAYVSETLPILRATYLPLREPLTTLLISALVVLPLLAGAAAYRLSGDRHCILQRYLFIAATGFVLAGIIQGKGYINHMYPGIALALVGLSLAVFRMQHVDHRQRLGLICLLALSACGWKITANVGPSPALSQAIARVAPPHPKMTALSVNLNVGHPVVRNIGGSWVGSRAALFVAGGAQFGLDRNPTPKARALLLRYAHDDAVAFARDVRQGAPDVILVDGTIGSGWVRAEPALATAMKSYRAAASADGIVIWTRRVVPRG